MSRLKLFFSFYILLLLFSVNINCYGTDKDTIVPQYKVTLREAHIGNLEIDTKLLDSYGQLPENIRQFYFDARSVFSSIPNADFTNNKIIEAAKNHNLLLMGGPMLGQLNTNGITIWMRPSTSAPITVKVTKLDNTDEKQYIEKSNAPGVEKRIELNRLTPDTEYKYTVYIQEQKIAEGQFKTPPDVEKEDTFRVAFGSCFHKIGLHNPILVSQILKRKPQAMMLLGDIAVDDRENQVSMHRSDYLLRDVSKPWRELAANVPLYTSWDDHDYYNNDLSGIPKGFTNTDVEAVRKVWLQNWNNPENEKAGIYFNTRIGPVEIIMLDTRSCRTNKKREQYGSYLGKEQLDWLKKTLKNTKAPFKIISSGTMWSDYISNGKDSWGTWDKKAREEIFSFIEKENITGVLLISGDRHGARGFTIPRPSGFNFYEFEAASLGGVPGPDAMAKDSKNQLFGYHGTSIIAFGEFTFEPQKDAPTVTFRLIDQFGTVLEKYTLPYSKLTPP